MIARLLCAATMAAMFALPVRADVEAPAGRESAAPAPDVPCTCRLAGRDFQLGAAACIRGRAARCERVLNNTSWTIGEAPCPISSSQPVSAAPVPQ